MLTLASTAITLLVAALTLFVLRRSRQLPPDLPNARSLHRSAIGRGGGVSIWLGWLAGTLWLASPAPWLFPLLGLIVVSLLDDRFGIAAGWRLLAQIVAAAAWIRLAGLDVDSLGFALVLLSVVWMANLYNFMDGSDGLAGLTTIIGFGTLGAAATLSDQGAPILAIAIAAIPFTWCNWPPARVFMGDVGSVPLGFLAAVFAITGWQAGWWPLWFPLLVFLPFVADASLTLLLRLLRGEKIWRAHREHAYQRLVQLGLGHGGTLALYGALIVGTSGSAFAALLRAPTAGPLLLAAWSVVFGVLFAVVAYSWSIRGSRLDESKC